MEYGYILLTYIGLAVFAAAIATAVLSTLFYIGRAIVNAVSLWLDRNAWSF